MKYFISLAACLVFVCCNRISKQKTGAQNLTQQTKEDIQKNNSIGLYDDPSSFTQKKTGHLKIEANGKSWEANIAFRLLTPVYHNSELFYTADNVQVIKSSTPALKKIFGINDEDHFYVPFLKASRFDTSSFVDLNNNWVSDSIEHRGRIIIDDVNFDGYKDILLYNEMFSGNNNPHYDIWLYNPEKQDYFQWVSGTTLGLWSIDRQKKTLLMGENGGGGLHYIETWKITSPFTHSILEREKEYITKSNSREVLLERKLNGRWKVIFHGSVDDYKTKRW